MHRTDSIAAIELVLEAHATVPAALATAIVNAQIAGTEVARMREEVRGLDVMTSAAALRTDPTTRLDRGPHRIPRMTRRFGMTTDEAMKGRGFEVASAAVAPRTTETTIAPARMTRFMMSPSLYSSTSAETGMSSIVATSRSGSKSTERTLNSS